MLLLRVELSEKLCDTAGRCCAACAHGGQWCDGAVLHVEQRRDGALLQVERSDGMGAVLRMEAGGCQIPQPCAAVRLTLC